MAKKPAVPKTVEIIKHDDAKRKNIPTAEHQSVIDDTQKNPKAIRYPRNTDLDPQLVWRGKDEQDWSDLVVHAPPLYIQEKVHPKALIDDLLRQSKESEYQSGGVTLDLFSDFNGIPKGVDKTEFYQHDQNWSNRMILGDSLQVMASLAEREGLRGKVQCIYFDPPYGIKFNSNFQWSTTSRDVKDGNAGHITREPEQVKAFRDTWRDGIHSYLTYLRDRLTVARDLLTESGSIFVQIGDENVHRVRGVMDEVFGQDNFVSQVVFRKTTGKASGALDNTCDGDLAESLRQRAVDGNRAGCSAGRSNTDAARRRRSRDHSPDHAEDTTPRHAMVHTRALATAIGGNDTMVHRVWRDSGLKPHLTKTFKVSNDPRFAEKRIDVVGLYWNPPEHALVSSCDEKSQIQALDRTQKSLPLFPGRLKTRTHDDKRNGTTTLFVAIELAEGKIIPECQPRHRHQEWLKFRKKIDAETPPKMAPHLIIDNYATALVSAINDDQTLKELTTSLCAPVIRPGREQSDGTRVPSRRFHALNPLAADDLKLLTAVSRPEFPVSGLRNQHLREIWFGSDTTDSAERRRRASAIRRKLSLLRAHGIVEKVCKSHSDRVTDKGHSSLSAPLATSSATTKTLNQLAA